MLYVSQMIGAYSNIGQTIEVYIYFSVNGSIKARSISFNHAI